MIPSRPTPPQAHATRHRHNHHPPTDREFRTSAPCTLHDGGPRHAVPSCISRPAHARQFTSRSVRLSSARHTIPHAGKYLLNILQAHMHRTHTNTTRHTHTQHNAHCIAQCMHAALLHQPGRPEVGIPSSGTHPLSIITAAPRTHLG
jgi:hypothetical protein